MSKKNRNKKKNFVTQPIDVSDGAVAVVDGDNSVPADEDSALPVETEQTDGTGDVMIQDESETAQTTDGSDVVEQTSATTEETANVEPTETTEKTENTELTETNEFVEESSDNTDVVSENVDETKEDVGDKSAEDGSESSEEPSIETKETEEVFDSETDVSDDEKREEELEKERLAEEKRLQKEQKRVERRAKTKKWFIDHRLFVTIVSLVFLLMVGVMVAHFVTTSKMVFVHNADDLIKASSQTKKSELKFKADVTVDGNIDLNGYTIDLDKYTLTVNGDLSVKSQDVRIGKQKWLWSDFEKGGKIVVSGRLFIDSKTASIKTKIVTDNLIVLSQDAYIDADLTSSSDESSNIWFMRNETAESLVGSFVSDSGKLTVIGENYANVRSSLLGNVDLFGTVNDIDGGNVVVLMPLSHCNYIRNCNKLYLKGNAYWQGFDVDTVKEYYFVEQLESPVLLVIGESGETELRISNVENADWYIIVYDGAESVKIAKQKDKSYTSYILPYKDPGSYIVSVKAVSDYPDRFNDGLPTEKTVEIYSTLEAPEIVDCKKVTLEGATSFILSIKNVAHAKEYVIEINGKTMTVQSAQSELLDVDVTELIGNNVGVYNIFVYAKADGTNYKNSQTEMYSFVYTVKLELGEIVRVSSEDGYVYSWQAVEGAIGYLVTVGDKQFVTTSTEISADALSHVSVKPLGKGYYKDGDTVTYFEHISSPDDQPSDAE